MGIELQQIVGDTFLAVALQAPGSSRSLLPVTFFAALRTLDRWVDRPPLNHLAYEVWFQGIKRKGTE